VAENLFRVARASRTIAAGHVGQVPLLSCRPAGAVQAPFGILREVVRRAARVRRADVGRAALLLALLPPRAVLRLRVRIGRALPTVLLALLLPRRLRRDRVVEVGGVVPAARRRRLYARARAVVLAVEALVRRRPKAAVAVRSALAPRAFFRVRVDAAPGRLPLLVLLALERRVRVALVVARGPLRLALFALDLLGVDEAVALRPFRRAAVCLVVSNVLRRRASEGPGSG
jgi:hypothetical protein